jgi:outer membrane receptor protein involved in Fe transport
MQKDDVIIQDSTRRNINGGKTLDRGIEADFNWQLSQTLQWQLQASYSKHQYGNDALAPEGNELDTAPRQLASTRLRWQPFISSTFEFEVQYQGDYFLDGDNLHRYEGHTLGNVRWRQQLNEQVYTVLRINNVADIDYAERADYAFGNYRYFTGEPRAAYIEVGIDF